MTISVRASRNLTYSGHFTVYPKDRQIRMSNQLGWDASSGWVTASLVNTAAWIPRCSTTYRRIESAETNVSDWVPLLCNAVRAKASSLLQSGRGTCLPMRRMSGFSVHP